jgi:hypothetical protein
MRRTAENFSRSLPSGLRLCSTDRLPDAGLRAERRLHHRGDQLEIESPNRLNRSRENRLPLSGPCVSARGFVLTFGKNYAYERSYCRTLTNAQ